MNNYRLSKRESVDDFVLIDTSNSSPENDCRRPSASYEFVENSQEEEKPKNLRFSAITPEQLRKYFDLEGRLVHELNLREALFHGGATELARREIWTFLFGLYPIMSTTLERKELDIENHYRYHALRLRCSMYLNDQGRDIYDDNLVITNSVTMDDFLSDNLDLPRHNTCISASDVSHFSHKHHMNTAKVFACKQHFELDTVDAWYRVINKDIPRTDRDHPYFQNGECSQKMKNILVTFGFFHPDVGYVQGMNDILTRFLVVLDNEVDAFWCFTHYMERVARDFEEDGMVEKVTLVQNLLKDLEPNLYSHFVDCEVEDLVFVHRWLLVSFKREFDYNESIKYFEIAQSRFLELDSPLAMSVQAEQHRLEVKKDQGKTRTPNHVAKTPKYTYEVFVCVAVIMLKRQQFLACTEASDVFHIACNIRGALNLQQVHSKAYELFYRFCQKSVTEQYEPNEKSNIISSISNAFRQLSATTNTIPIPKISLDNVSSLIKSKWDSIAEG